jgi:hypothetical protein
MAELIPVQYRIRAAQKTVLTRWALAGTAAIAAAAIGIFCAWNWQHQQVKAVDDLTNDFRQKSPILVRAKEIKNNYDQLAQRLENMDGLRDDTTLIALLNHISAARNEYNCFETLQIDARKSASGEKDSYFVRIVGVASDPKELAGLMDRLSKDSNPKINVILETTKREQFLDETVLRFHILCERQQG